MGLRERQERARKAVRLGTEDLERDYFLLEHHGLIDASSRTDLGRLTDIPGVGDGTASKLKRAGIHDPTDLQGHTQSELAAIDGIGPKTAARIRAYMDQTAPRVDRPIEGEFDTAPRTARSESLIRTRSGWVDISETAETVLDAEQNWKPENGVGPHADTVAVEGQDKEDAIEFNAERSEKARTADESFNAPISLSFSQWAAHPNRYDYPGVDTISRSRKVDRARSQLHRGFEVGAIERVDVSSSALSPKEAGEGVKGKFIPGMKDVRARMTVPDAIDVLAHETGHAVDNYLGRPSATIFEDERVREETRELIEKREGGRIPDDAHSVSGENELWANLFEAATVEPRATKRDAPHAYRALEEEVHGGFGPI